jgi:hypothetical protein
MQIYKNKHNVYMFLKFKSVINDDFPQQCQSATVRLFIYFFTFVDYFHKNYHGKKRI